MSGELLPCPFCGGSAAYDLAPPHGAAISCNQCDTIVVEGDEQRVRLLWNTRMTTKQDSVDVERDVDREMIRGYLDDIIERAERHGATEGLWLFGWQWRIIADALSLPITQRDEQGDHVPDSGKMIAKTYAAGIADAAAVARSTADEWLRFRRQGGISLGAETYDAHDCDHANRTAAGIATAIRRLSIEQGDQDGGEE